MEWNKTTENVADLKPVLAWVRYYAMPIGEVIWDEKKKIEKHCYALAYIDKGLWWDVKATINSEPLEVIKWMELPSPPKD